MEDTSGVPPERAGVDTLGSWLLWRAPPAVPPWGSLSVGLHGRATATWRGWTAFYSTHEDEAAALVRLGHEAVSLHHPRPPVCCHQQPRARALRTQRTQLPVPDPEEVASPKLLGGHT